MIAHVFLALCLGLVAAQQEYLMHTDGKGGVECGKFHKCIKDAKCEDKEKVKMCECKNTTLIGNAKLQCFKEEDHNVWIQNDPHLKNFYKEFATLDSPCPYRVMNLVFKPDEYTRVILELFGENTLFKEGDYFLTKLTLSTTVYLYNDMMKQIMEFEGDVTNDLNSDIYNYTLIARSLDTSFVEIPEGVEDVVQSDDSRFVDYTMEVGKDADDNLLTVEIKGLGIKVFFRPPSTKEEINNIELPMVPGAVINVKREYWPLLDISESEYDLAALPQGPSLKDKATDLRVSKPVYVHYLMLSKSGIEVGYNDSLCQMNHDIFRDECNTEQDKLDMLKPCHSIYAEKKFLDCLTSKHSMEEYKRIHKEFFQRCELSLCRKDARECEAMKREMPSITGCVLPDKVSAIDCSSL